MFHHQAKIMIPVKQSQYIYPPRPNTAIPREMSTQLLESDNKSLWDGWKAQLKYNDTRCLIKLREDGNIELWNRHAERLSYSPPVLMLDGLRHIHSLLGEGYHLLDGGLIHHKHPHIKNTLVLWDLLVLKGEHLIGTTYSDRYQHVLSLTTSDNYIYKGLDFGHSITDDIFVPSMWDLKEATEAWSVVDMANCDQSVVLEGIMLKNTQAALQFGFSSKNNEDSMVRSRITTGRHIF